MPDEIDPTEEEDMVPGLGLDDEGEEGEEDSLVNSDEEPLL